MAFYYVDLSLITNGHIGTETDPFSYEDYISSSIDDSSTVYMRGSIDRSSLPLSLKGGYNKSLGFVKVRTLENKI